LFYASKHTKPNSTGKRDGARKWEKTHNVNNEEHIARETKFSLIYLTNN